MAKVIRDGPESIAGISVTRLIDVQGSEQKKNFLCHMRWNKSILEDVTSRLPQFEAQWLKAFRWYLKGSNSQLELEKTYVYPIQRINDEYIMPK
eukprot:3082589-Ditylum_brightwellii.AAC.1